MIARDIVRPISRSIVSSILGYDTDAQAYFDAVEAASGSFDLTSINATYTESYVKTAHSNFYAGLKTDGVWDKLTEFYLLAGKTFGGLTVKGKGTGSLTNNNFVTGDWLGAGSGAGLTGDASTKYLDTGLAQVSPSSSSISVYQTATATGLFKVAIGSRQAFQVGEHLIYNDNADASFRERDTIGANVTSTSGFPGYMLGVGRASETETYLDGVSISTDPASNRAVKAFSYYIGALNESGTASGYSDATLTFAHVGTGLTDTDASNLSTRVNTLMTALGANVY